MDRDELIKSEVEWLNDIKCDKCPYSGARSCVGWRTAILCKAAEKSPEEAYRANMRAMQRKIESVQMIIEGVNCGLITLDSDDAQSIFNAAYDLQTSDKVHSDFLNALVQKGVVLTLEGFIETFKSVENIEKQVKRSVS